MEAYMRKVVATMIFALAITPAHAQKIPPINLLQDNTPDAYTRQRQKDIESEYNATMKKIPDKKKSNADPWQDLRRPGADGKQHAPSAR
jgi:Skp family chaperone for outer membrane proteins